MASYALNFKEAPEWLRLQAIKRKNGTLPSRVDYTPRPGTSGVPGAYKPVASGLPNMPSVTGNKAENSVLENLYEANANAYNKAKIGKNYKLQSIKAGDGFVHSDYGQGSGAAIPYQIETRNATRRTGKKADVKAYEKDRKKKEPSLVAKKSREEAIKRRLNG